LKLTGKILLAQVSLQVCFYNTGLSLLLHAITIPVQQNVNNSATI